MGMTKRKLLQKISDVDDKMLALTKERKDVKIHPEDLTVKELKEVLHAFETLYSAFDKMLAEKPKKIFNAEKKVIHKKSEFHCGVEESGGHAYNCNDCPNKCEEYYQWDKEMNR